MSSSPRTRWRRTRSRPGSQPAAAPAAKPAGARTRPRQAARPDQNGVEERSALEFELGRYADIFDFSPVGYATLDVNGIILDVNLTAANMFGYERRLLKGLPLLCLVTGPDRRAFVRHLVEARIVDDLVARTELRFKRKDGQEVLLQLLSRRNLNEAPLVGRVNTVISDITDQRAAELARQRLAAIVESSDDAIVGTDLNGVINSWNGAAERLFDYTTGEAMGQPVTLLIPDDRLEEGSTILSKIRLGENVTHYDTIRQRKDGTLVPVSLTVSPVRDLTGRVIGAAKIARDITRRKESEAELLKARKELEQRVRERTAQLTNINAVLQEEVQAHREAEEALRHSEARLQAILDNSPAMIFLKDTEGRYLIYNRRFADAFHLAPGQLIGKTDFEGFPREQAERFRANDLKVIQSGWPMQFEEVSLQDDAQHTSIVSKFPIHDTEGRVYAVGGVVTDITERKRLEEEVVRIKEHEQERIAQDLHDGLGQQLAGTWFLSDTLRKSLAAQDSPELAAATKIVELLETAVAQVRGLARGLSPVSIQPNGLMAALEEMATRVSELFRVQCQFVCAEPVLLRDPNRATHLYRIAQEALNNAFKHGRAKAMEIELSARSDAIILRVADDGTGFTKVPKGHKGMGLRTMRYRADLIGADFAVRKRPGRRGTEVVCRVRIQGKKGYAKEIGEQTGQ